MKIEMDAINGLVVVDDFYFTDTKVMSGSSIKDYLKDQLDVCLGFEVTEEEAREIVELGYKIHGFTV
jgi:hypothetical protein